MPDIEALRRHQGQQFLGCIRKAVNAGDPAAALNLILGIKTYVESTLKTLMIISCATGFGNNNELGKQTRACFKIMLTRAKKSKNLQSAGCWANNLKRRSDIDVYFRNELSQRRHELEPDWNGSWKPLFTKVGGKKITDLNFGEVNDPQLCLTCATQQKQRNREPWLDKYIELGGDMDDPKYLKMVVLGSAHIKGKLDKKTKQAFSRLTVVLGVKELRAFMRKLAPQNSTGGYISLSVQRYALLTYCHCERLEFHQSDLIHIAHAGGRLNFRRLCEVAIRSFARIKRSEKGQDIFTSLVERYGWPNEMSSRVAKDLGYVPNPIWTNVLEQRPINADARRILVDFSREEIDNE